MNKKEIQDDIKRRSVSISSSTGSSSSSSDSSAWPSKGVSSCLRSFRNSCRTVSKVKWLTFTPDLLLSGIWKKAQEPPAQVNRHNVNNLKTNLGVNVNQS